MGFVSTGIYKIEGDVSFGQLIKKVGVDEVIFDE